MKQSWILLSEGGKEQAAYVVRKNRASSEPIMTGLETIVGLVSLRNTLLFIEQKEHNSKSNSLRVREFQEDGEIISLGIFSQFGTAVRMSASLDYSLVFTLAENRTSSDSNLGHVLNRKRNKWKVLEDLEEAYPWNVAEDICCWKRERRACNS